MSVCIFNPALNLMEFLVSNSCFLGGKKIKTCLIVHQAKRHFPAPPLRLTDQPPALLLGDRENQVFPSSPCCLIFCKFASCLLDSWGPPRAPCSSWCPPPRLVSVLGPSLQPCPRPCATCRVLPTRLLSTHAGCFCTLSRECGQSCPRAGLASSEDGTETLPPRFTQITRFMVQGAFLRI